MNSINLKDMFVNVKSLEEVSEGKISYHFGDLVAKHHEVSDIWTVSQNGDKFVRMSPDKIGDLLAAEIRRVEENYEAYRDGKVKEEVMKQEEEVDPEVLLQKEDDLYESLITLLAEEGTEHEFGQPANPADGTVEKWLVRGVRVYHTTESHKWAFKGMSEKSPVKTTWKNVLNKLKGNPLEEDVETIATARQPNEVPAEPAKVIEYDKDSLIVLLNSKVLPVIQADMASVWPLPNGWTVMYSVVDNIWRISLREGAPLIRSNVKHISGLLDPQSKVEAVPVESKAVKSAKEAVKMSGLKKIAVIERLDKNEKDSVRLPFSGAHRLFGVVFEGDKYFRADGPYAEVSMVLEKLMPCEYIEYVSDNPKELEKVRAYGYTFKGDHYACFTGYQRDDRGKAYLVKDTDFTKLKDLRGIGISVFVSDPTKTLKAGKYLNRLFAPTWKHTFGVHTKWEDESNTGFVELENGKTISIRVVSLKGLDPKDKARADGGGLISFRGAIALGLTNLPKLGDAWQCTFGTKVGMGKGNYVYKKDLDYDVVIYDAKELLKTEVFYFGCFGKLKKIIPATDMQAWDNFRYERPGMADSIAQIYRDEFWNALQDDWGLTKMILRQVNNTIDDQSFYNDDPDSVNYDARVLKEAIINGWSVQRHPGLFRRAYNFMLKSVMDMESGRIPMDHVALSGYVIHDPFAYDSFGNLIPVEEEIIKEDECVMPGVPVGTKVACYRQPSENQNAYVILTVVHHPKYDGFKDKGIIILGAGCHVVLARLGGGDLDDRFIVVFDKYWVKMFEELALNPYPETERIVSLEDDRKSEEDLMRGKYKIREFEPQWYNTRHFATQIDRKRQSGAGIGPVVNMDMIDNRLSNPDDWTYIMAQLNALIDQETKFGNVAKVNDLLIKRDWLMKRKPYQAAFYATNLEHVIDASTKDNSILSQLGNVTDAVRQFHSGIQDDREPVEGINPEGTLVYPYIALIAKRGRTRIPLSKELKKDYIVLDCLMSRSLKQLIKERDALINQLKLREWIMVKPADSIFMEERDTLSSDIKELVGNNRGRKQEDEPGYLQRWGRAWKEFITKGDMSKEAVLDAYNTVEVDMDKWLKQFSGDILRQMAVELYCHVYHTEYLEAPQDDNFNNRSFKDALLWTKRMGNALIQASRCIKYMDFKTRKLRPLAGLILPVELDVESYDLRDSMNVEITINEGGVVYRKSSGEAIGTIPVKLKKEGIEPGDFIMSEGLVKLREPNMALLPENN